MTQRIALLRGINVGRAERIAMADLRSLIEDLGCSDVRTLLNSGNAMFEVTGRNNRALASDLEAAISRQFRLEVPIVVLSDKELNVVIGENSLAKTGRDPARLLVAFVNGAAVLRKASALLKERWGPEAFAVGSKAAYIWCPDGIIKSNLAKAFSRTTGDAATTRNWATVLKLQQAVGAGRDSA